MGSVFESTAYRDFSKKYIHPDSISIGKKDFDAMAKAVREFWKLAQSSGFKNLSAPIMGYDFHIGPDGPKLIEINSNAAGLLVLKGQELAQKLVEIFTTEAKAGATIAIVDENPPAQFYYLEFEILKEILEKSGFKVLIRDSQNLDITGIDLIYWRHTDFLLEHFPELKKAHAAGKICISPSPEIFSLLSDKSNLIKWNENPPVNLKEFILPAKLITPANANELWESRKDWVFKPARRFGGKGVYVGKKLTHPKWEELKQSGDYLAQQYLEPIEKSGLKFDFRAYAWRDQLLHLTARGYSGQVTNFRTEGGGFYSVKTI